MSLSAPPTPHQPTRPLFGTIRNSRRQSGQEQCGTVEDSQYQNLVLAFHFRAEIQKLFKAFLSRSTAAGQRSLVNAPMPLRTRDRFRVGWLNGFSGRGSESRRCSRDTYPESYITTYTSTRRSTRCRVDAEDRWRQAGLVRVGWV